MLFSNKRIKHGVVWGEKIKHGFVRGEKMLKLKGGHENICTSLSCLLHTVCVYKLNIRWCSVRLTLYVFIS